MAIVRKYPARVVAIHNSIDGVYTLELESLGKQFKYDPGQFLHLALDEYDPTGQWPDSRCFSMQSSPNETLIKITYAVKGHFTTRMQRELKLGSKVTLKLPYGDLFQQPHNKENTVFIAGGTGITPFLSLFTHASFQEYTSPKIYLGLRSKAYNLYENELQQTGNPSTLISIVYQDKEGALDIQKVLEENGLESNYFISGPPVMIKSFKSYLISEGVSQNQVLTDDWE